MNPVNLILLILFTTIVVSFIWARFNFFKIGPSTPSFIARLYDPVVAIQVVATFVEFFRSHVDLGLNLYLATILYLTSLGLFWWTIDTTKQMGFALTENVEKVFKTGPFAWIRHPFYTSYICVWVGSILLFNSIVLWITLIYLVSFYYQVARKEEAIITRSSHSEDYLEYRKSVGMFFPRIIKWKL